MTRRKTFRNKNSRVFRQEKQKFFQQMQSLCLDFSWEDFGRFLKVPQCLLHSTLMKKSLVHKFFSASFLALTKEWAFTKIVCNFEEYCTHIYCLRTFPQLPILLLRYDQSSLIKQLTISARHLLDVKSFSKSFEAVFGIVLGNFLIILGCKVGQLCKSFDLVYLDFLQLFQFPSYKVENFVKKFIGFLSFIGDKWLKIYRYRR